MRIVEATPDGQVLERLAALSADWEAENCCHGYHANNREDLLDKRVFLAMDGETVTGYLLGHQTHTERDSSIMPRGSACFELDELYVRPELRSQGIGKALYDCAEAAVKADGMEFILLSTPSKNHRRILHFYIDELGMEFWSARLYKRL